MKLTTSLVGAALGLSWSAGAGAQVDAAAAEALTRKSGCLTCHSVTQKREGPAFKDVAAKYKGKGGAEDVVFKHITTGPKIKVDGKEEVHDSVKTKSEAEARNVARWILSR